MSCNDNCKQEKLNSAFNILINDFLTYETNLTFIYFYFKVICYF